MPGAKRLAPDGTWTRLVLDGSGSGALVLGKGLQDQGEWEAFCEASSDISSSQPLSSVANRT